MSSDAPLLSLIPDVRGEIWKYIPQLDDRARAAQVCRLIYADIGPSIFLPGAWWDLSQKLSTTKVFRPLFRACFLSPTLRAWLGVQLDGPLDNG